MSHLYLCKSASLLITSFQFYGKCFWLIYRFKTILLAHCGNPWIWIACPPFRILWQKIFFFSSALVINSWKSLEVWMPFFQLHQMSPGVQNPSKPMKKLKIFFSPTIQPLTLFFPPQFKHFWIYFFLFAGCLCPHISFFTLVTPIKKHNLKKSPKDSIAPTISSV